MLVYSYSIYPVVPMMRHVLTRYTTYLYPFSSPIPLVVNPKLLIMKPPNIQPVSCLVRESGTILVVLMCLYLVPSYRVAQLPTANYRHPWRGSARRRAYILGNRAA